MIAEHIDEFSEQAKTSRMARVHIESLARSEEQLGKEICDFTRQELLDAIKTDIKSYYALQAKLSVAQEYFQWAYGGAVKINVVASDIDLSDVFKQTMYPSFDKLYNAISSYDDGDAIRPIACLCWLGLSHEQMVNTREDDVTILDDGTVTVVCGNQVFEDKNVKLALTLKRYMATEELLSANKQCQYTIALIRDGYLIRKTAKKKTPGVPLTIAFVRAKLQAGELNARDIALSGQFYRALSDNRADGAKFQEWLAYLTYVHWKKAFDYEQ